MNQYTDGMKPTIEEVYSEYYNSILNFVFLRLNNIHEAEDLTSKIFEKANRLIESYTADRGAVSTWLYKITTTQIVDYFRTNHQDKYKAVSDFVNENGDCSFQFENPEKADQIMENQELRKRLLKSFRDLKPDYRKVATMYFIREYKYEEIAEKLKMKIGTVKGMISRSREMLKNELKDLHKVKAKQEIAMSNVQV